MTYPDFDPMAVAVMVSRCGWDPMARKTAETATLNGNGTALITLPSLWVTDVTAVTVTRRDGTDYVATIGVGQDVEWSDNGLLEWKSFGVWPEGRRNVTVVYDGGYDEPPDDLAAALRSIGKRTSGSGPVQSRKMGTAAIAYAASIAEGGLLTIEEMVLDSYRIPKAQ